MKKLVLLSGLLAVLFVSGCGCGEGYSEGERIGIVTKFSYKGLFWKGWEGTLLMVAPAGMMIAQPETLIFTVDPRDQATVDKINAAAMSGNRVKLVYRQWFIKPLGSLKSAYVIRDVQAVEP